MIRSTFDKQESTYGISCSRGQKMTPHKKNTFFPVRMQKNKNRRIAKQILIVCTNSFGNNWNIRKEIRLKMPQYCAKKENKCFSFAVAQSRCGGKLEKKRKKMCNRSTHTDRACVYEAESKSTRCMYILSRRIQQVFFPRYNFHLTQSFSFRAVLTYGIQQSAVAIPILYPKRQYCAFAKFFILLAIFLRSNLFVSAAYAAEFIRKKRPFFFGGKGEKRDNLNLVCIKIEVHLSVRVRFEYFFCFN